jgi:two-component system, chemotaxis family, protein-glutamate methylesterase/glutaminase
MLPSPTEKPIRVLVVDDSSLQRRMLVSMLESDAAFRVVGAASNGAEAVRLARELLPDVITMDLRMPTMDGLTASANIIQELPIPILMVTSSASKDDQQLVAKAFTAGVLAIIAKPSIKEQQAEFLRMVKGVSKVKVIRRKPSLGKHNNGKPDSNGIDLNSTVTAEPEDLPFERRYVGRRSKAFMPRSIHRVEIIGIVSSTGGPQALEALLTRLPADFPVPIVIVQHIVEGFASSLAEWLRPLCAPPVALAAAGAAVEPGIWIAPGGAHLTVQSGTFASSFEMPVSGQRPSGTVLVRSLVREYRQHALGVILSGMGDDGAAGFELLHRAGGLVIAQDEASSIIHSMPSAVIRAGVAGLIMPPAEIGDVLIDFVRRGRE